MPVLALGKRIPHDRKPVGESQPCGSHRWKRGWWTAAGGFPNLTGHTVPVHQRRRARALFVHADHMMQSIST